ncbi:MAG: NADH-quinone oxidoreductase subunit NuoH [Bacteroidaceae bacterium]|nr:NADH-quinone oxidoreductase subunit NuoH [Bacteroidales bacterium]MBP3670917.1 NADH-quinone oxidoreductase subunit NuoH [Bacteroidaceae bacterium]MBQ2979420.1 NADH-quinone oxidoreductase subunit NuoH [Bacteroidaceae bacterium]
MYDFSNITTWIHNLLMGFLPEWATLLIEFVLIGVAILALYCILALFLIYFERRVAGAFQCRLGPNRVGPFGIFQSIADMLKILIKELIYLKNIDHFLFNLAPFFVLVASMLTFACLPWGNGLQVINYDVGVFFMLAVSGLGIIGVLLAGWASNSKYTVIGAMRAGAQMISYELSIGLSILTIVAISGTMSVTGIVDAQYDGWFLFKGHLPALIAFIIYLVAGSAEINRGPFDMAEAESELTAGYHTEYSGIHFGFYYLAEYLNLFIMGGIATTLFLGGWMPLHIPGWETFNMVMDYIPSIVWFLGKSIVVVWISMWFRWTFPRLRIDQLLKLEWKYLLPISLVNLAIMSVVVAMGWHF